MPTPDAPSAPAMLLAAAGLIAVLFPLLRLQLRLGVSVEAFGTQVLKLVEANNVDRALRLCAAVPHAPVAIGAGAMLARLGPTEEDRLRVGAIWLRQVLALRPALRRFERLTQLGAGLSIAAAVLMLLGGVGPQGAALLGPLSALGMAVATHQRERAMEQQTLALWERLFDRIVPGGRLRAIADFEAGRRPVAEMPEA